MARLGAGIRKRPDGIYEKRITINNKRYSVYSSSQKELAQKEEELRKRLSAGIGIENKSLTLDKYFVEWLRGKEQLVKSASIRVYTNQYYTHISPYLGKKKIQKIEKRDIKETLNKVPNTLSETTYNGIVRVIKMIFKDATNDEILLRNPTQGIKGKKEDKKRASETYHRALTVEEQNAFLDVMKDDYYYDFILFLLCTGMRFGEVSALEWSDIDEVNNVIHVCRTQTTTKDGKTTVGAPKSASSKRDIPLTDTTKEILKEQRRKRTEYSSVIPFTKRIFSTPYGNMTSNYVINRAIEIGIKKMNENGFDVEHFTAHALRDTFATRYIEQGGTPQTLKTILGHNSLQMTMDLYSHVMPNTKQEEMNRIRII